MTTVNDVHETADSPAGGSAATDGVSTDTDVDASGATSPGGEGAPDAAAGDEGDEGDALADGEERADRQPAPATAPAPGPPLPGGGSPQGGPAAESAAPASKTPVEVAEEAGLRSAPDPGSAELPPGTRSRLEQYTEEMDDHGGDSEQLLVGEATGTAPLRQVVHKAGAETALERDAREDPERYSAESLGHALGFLAPGEVPDAEIEAQLREELANAGVDLDRYKLSYETLTEKDRERFRLVELQVALRKTLENLEDLTAASAARVRFQLDSTDAVRLNLLKQAQSVFLLFDASEARIRKMLDDLGGQARSIDASYAALQRKFERLDQLVYDVEERALAMREEIRGAGASIRGSGPAVQRLAFLGAVSGAVAGGVVGFVVMLSIWLAFA